ncbi:uncharacterized protein LOC100184486 [Ciona intestinalis]
MTESEDMTPATSEESVAVPEPSGRRNRGRHAAYNVMVKRSIIALKAKSGSSRKSIIKYICAHNTVKKTNCVRAVGRALKRMLKSGHIYRNKGGRFKLTGKGRGLKAKKRRRRRRKGKKSKKGKKKKGKKSKKGKKKKRKKSKKGKKKKKRRSRKSKRGKKGKKRSRKSPKRANRRRKSAKRRKSKKGRKGKKRKR